LLARPGAAAEAVAYAANHGLRPEALDAIIAREGLIRLAANGGHVLIGGPVLLTVLRQMREALAAHHALQADQPGLTQARLRLALLQRFEASAFAVLVAHALRRGEIEAAGGYLRLPGHAPRLSREHEALWQDIAPQLCVEPFKPPRVTKLALLLRRREESIRGLLKRMAKRGEVFEVAPDHFLSAEAVRDLEIAAGATARTTSDGWFGAAAYRDRIGGGRKMAILILEFMDRRGTTSRRGDLRRMKAGL
ncbi:MAG: SelB C-terminal domain-containing protein, partial [Beijerinckiaceae bacterium]